jgi:hypothetical protein
VISDHFLLLCFGAFFVLFRALDLGWPLEAASPESPGATISTLPDILVSKAATIGAIVSAGKDLTSQQKVGGHMA